MFLVEETEEQVAKIYHRLFAALMVRMGASVGLEPLKKQEPVSHIIEILLCLNNIFWSLCPLGIKEIGGLLVTEGKASTLLTD